MVGMLRILKYQCLKILVWCKYNLFDGFLKYIGFGSPKGRGYLLNPSLGDDSSAPAQ